MYNKTEKFEIARMHTFCRPHESESENAFIAEFVDTLPGVKQDGFGNRFVRIGESPILFSAHTDTVHHEQGAQHVTMKNGILSLSKPYQKKGYVLGADDGAGVWLLRELIKANTPGLYVFHRAEEIGGQGSDYIAFDNQELLNGIEMAIAFDRKGRDSVITHQGERTASDKFAWGLADAIPLNGLSPDSFGIFTDTANYSNLVSECTNISVGYENAHTAQETLDVDFLISLRDALLKTDWASLTAHRDPYAETEYAYSTRHWWDDYEEDFQPTTKPGFSSFESLITEHPDVVRDVLEAYGVTESDLLDEIYGIKGAA